VSLPFSDHCEPLADDPDCETHILTTVAESMREQNFRYFETRPLNTASRVAPAWLCESTREYCFHRIDLTPDAQTLFRNFHKDSIQRKIRRAEREGLRYEVGRSQQLVDAFYDLQVITRKRHGLPAQPKAWFQNVLACLGPAARIRVTYKDEIPTASIFTMRHKDTIVYKYGASDHAYNNLGGMHLLFWNAIKEAKLANLRTFDLGRSAFDNQGLITFKDRWGALRTTLSYSRFTCSHSPKVAYDIPISGPTNSERLAVKVFSVMPTFLSRALGALLYRHVG
jgi:CelD/BcsL family acetyltransferase involved in cellulose biosynthesis